MSDGPGCGLVELEEPQEYWEKLNLTDGDEAHQETGEECARDERQRRNEARE